MGKITKKQQVRINNIAALTKRDARAKAKEEMRKACIQAVRDALLDGTISQDAYEFISGNMRNIE